MKNFAFKITTVLCIGMMLTACGPSGPTNDEVFNTYREWASTQEKLGQPIRPLPPEAMVDHCRKAPDQPRGKAVLFYCYIRFGGKNDPILNPFDVAHEPDGRWVP
jgi:hypothetical protein